MFVVGIDCGRSAVKVRSKNYEFKFASVHGKVNQEKIAGMPVVKQDKDIFVRISGAVWEDNVYVVGDAAYSYLEETAVLHAMNDDLFLEYSKLYSLVAIALSMEREDIDKEKEVVVGFNLTFDNFYLKDKVREQLEGAHEVELLDLQGRVLARKVFTVSKVGIVYQGWSALMDKLLDAHGKIRAEFEALQGMDGVIIDIGRKTLDVVAVKKLRPFHGSTHNIGTVALLRAAQEVLMSEYHIKKSIVELEERLLTGQLITLKSLRGVSVEEDLFPLAIEKMEPVIRQAVIEELGETTPDYVFLVGGGSVFYKTIIEQIFPYTIVVDNPVFANAVGLYRFFERAVKSGG